MRIGGRVASFLKAVHMDMSGEVKVGKCGVTRVTGLENVELRWGVKGSTFVRLLREMVQLL